MFRKEEGMRLLPLTAVYRKMLTLDKVCLPWSHLGLWNNSQLSEFWWHVSYDNANNDLLHRKTQLLIKV